MFPSGTAQPSSSSSLPVPDNATNKEKNSYWFVVYFFLRDSVARILLPRQETRDRRRETEDKGQERET